MKKGIGFLAFSGWLLASGARVYGGVFNIRDYGADKGTDNILKYRTIVDRRWLSLISMLLFYGEVNPARVVGSLKGGCVE